MASVMKDSSSKEEEAPSTATPSPENEPSPPPPPPDGGTHAWLSVLGALLVFTNTWGLVQAFGAYQSYYTTTPPLSTTHSTSTISWIGTLQAFLLVFIGVVSGPLYDQGHLRVLVVVGSAMIVVGVMLLSLAVRYWQILLTQSLCVGLGSGLLFTPSLAQITVLFDRNRPIALGVAMMGTGIGGIVYPIVFDQLEPRIGFAWATRTIGFLALGTLSISVATLAWKKTPKKPPRALFEPGALKEAPFVLYALSAFLLFTGYWIPWFYIPLYGEFGVGATRTFSAYLLAITNASGIVGRLLTPLLQKKLSPLQTILAASLLADILLFAWISIHRLPNFIAFCVLWGLFSGPLAVLPAAAVAQLSPSLNVVGTRMGMIWAFSSFGNLIGTPIAGAVSTPREEDFLGGQLYAGACMLASVGLTGVIIALMRVEKRKKEGL